MKAWIFPGQGSQFPGMGKELYESDPAARKRFEAANDILGFSITDVIFDGSEEDLKQTKVTQPAIFLHSVALAENMKIKEQPNCVAGHSLGEFSALVANDVLDFESGLKLVAKRAMAMQKACEIEASTMAAILGLEDHVVEEICAQVDGIVVPANYNCPGQLVISGAVEAVKTACERMVEAGARRAVPLPVGGAFHSPLMEVAKTELEAAIQSTAFNNPTCPIYQNVTARPVNDANQIKENLIAQLTAPVRWTQSVQQMLQDGVNTFVEVGPGKVLQGLVKKMDRSVETIGVAS